MEFLKSRPVRKPGSLVSRGLTALGLGVAISLLLLGGLTSLTARQDAWHLAERASTNLRLALERDISRNIALLDLTLQGVVEALAEPGIEQASPGVRRHALFDRSASAEDLGSILVLDKDGVVLESSTPRPKSALTFSDRRYFSVHRDRSDVGLYISGVLVSRLHGGEPILSLSRRLSTKEGEFAGVVSAGLRLSYFRHLFETIDVGLHGSISLVGTDGTIVWRYPATDGNAGLDILASPIFQAMSSAREGRYVGASGLDGVRRLFSFARIGTLPLILSVNLAEDDIYAKWRQRTVIIAPALSAMCAAIVTLSLLFRREMARRTAAEAALTVAAHDLSVIAATDALTGLANRRTFEMAIDREWKRALRDRSEMSLLMIDADWFKRFNDGYGHQEGDRILKCVAACIQANLRRPGDLAARFGGEEFVVLLPVTDILGAVAFAETLRSAIDRLALPHCGSPVGRVTVSIGAASVAPARDQTDAILVKAADEALYAAKRDGRNCVRHETLEAPLARLERWPETIV